jgi:hypothetical protein
VNILSGIGLIATYAFGVYDGVSNYRQQEIRPFVAGVAGGGGVVGIGGSF